MIIGIDASRANHAQKTGVEWYAWHIIEQLKTQNTKLKTGESLQFVLYSDTPLIGSLGKLPENWESRVLHWPPKRLWTHVRMSWEMFRNPPDVLFVPAHVVPLIHPKKTVMMVHDIAALQFPHTYNWFERRYTLWSAKYALKHLWKIITPSEFTKSELTKLSADIRPELMSKARHKLSAIQVVHHGYDRRYKKIDDQNKIQAVLKKYNIKQPFFLSVGRLETKKNTANIIRAFTQFRTSYKLSAISYQLVLVGQPGHGYEGVKEAIVESAYKSDIRLLGWVQPEDVVPIMNAATTFVFPSLYEGFGLPILESFACGTPVIAGSGSSLEEVGGDAALYVNPKNYEEIANAMQRVVSDELLRQTLIKKGQERLNNFSWEKSAGETLEILVS
jgi:glycosyltransferase involved in cell wall biosynthesis